MNEQKSKVGFFDAVGIAFLAIVVRLGDSFLALLLQFLGVTAGVAMIWFAFYEQPLVSVFFAVLAWLLWWLGVRLQDIASQHPLDQVRKNP